MESRPFSLATTISPGATSRTISALRVESAQVSEAKMIWPSRLPMHSGWKPCGSRQARSFLALIMTME